MARLKIPKAVAEADDLVVLRRKQFDELIAVYKKTAALDRDLAASFKQFKRGKVVGPFKTVKALRASLDR